MMHYCYGDGTSPREAQPGLELACPRCAERAYLFQHPTQVNCKTQVRAIFEALADEWVDTGNPAAVQAGRRRVVERFRSAVERADADASITDEAAAQAYATRTQERRL